MHTWVWELSVRLVLRDPCVILSPNISVSYYVPFLILSVTLFSTFFLFSLPLFLARIRGESSTGTNLYLLYTTSDMFYVVGDWQTIPSSIAPPLSPRISSPARSNLSLLLLASSPHRRSLLCSSVQGLLRHDGTTDTQAVALCVAGAPASRIGRRRILAGRKMVVRLVNSPSHLLHPIPSIRRAGTTH